MGRGWRFEDFFRMDIHLREFSFLLRGGGGGYFVLFVSWGGGFFVGFWLLLLLTVPAAVKCYLRDRSVQMF